MAKERIAYACGECGYESAKWMGKCPQCDSWNTLVEAQAVKPRPGGEAARAQRLSSVSALAHARAPVGIGELDRVLGGGLIRGMVVLLGGDPGIGKSTLLLQAADRLAEESCVMYVSGEESAAQLKLRAERLAVKRDILVLCETDVDAVIAEAQRSHADVLIIDSIQTMTCPEAAGVPGSVSQVRAATALLTGFAKQNGAAVWIVGHVTKDGSIAGPRILEHMVDTVLYFEGERQAGLRLLRAVKNRFGSTNEVGVFEMGEEGMREVADPSRLFLSGGCAVGCAVTCVLEGSRPMLAEVQSLLANNAYGNPRRTSAGVDGGRLALLLAVLERKAHLRLHDKDVYVNVVGNLRLDERGTDLAVALCIASALADVALPAGTACLGEIGLTGEIRPVPQVETRVRECVRLGYTTVIIPKGVRVRAPEGAVLTPVTTIHEVVAKWIGGMKGST